MNKIERAIYDTNVYLEGLKKYKLRLIAEINAIEEVLNIIKSINNNKSIPHIEDLDKKNN